MTLIDFFKVDESQKDTPNPAQEDESDLLPRGVYLRVGVYH